ncbi:hypothetical protein DPMN_067485 [Dreissena polymorpha]|uniref:Uncharacterized protein n=1 Tax=Dreissena polymorpha TaxID=45954 RepID=A0A9D4BLD6_DREPO|nr:hypothetical protein DPMN_067485 [Dreissena polymorpha]
MALQFLPAEHIPFMFGALDERANNDHLDAVMVYVFNTWINSSIFPMECWSIFINSTNNELRRMAQPSEHQGGNKRAGAILLTWGSI